MIGRLSGKIHHQEPPYVLVDVQGVGYEVAVPTSVFYEVKADTPIHLWIHTLTREDALELYGFATAQDRQWFRTLLKVSGIGAKMGLAVLSSFKYEEFLHAIANEEVDLLMKIPGVGKKTASRILVELADKLPKPSGALTAQSAGEVTRPGVKGTYSQVIAALESLGFAPKEAERKAKAAEHEDQTLQEWIKGALQQ